MKTASEIIDERNMLCGLTEDQLHKLTEYEFYELLFGKPTDDRLHELIDHCRDCCLDPGLDDLKREGEFNMSIMLSYHLGSRHMRPGLGGRLPITRLSGSEQDIVDVIRAANRRLNQKETLSALSANGKIPSHGTTKVVMAAMVRHGILTRGTDKHGDGYGLPEWN